MKVETTVLVILLDEFEQPFPRNLNHDPPFSALEEITMFIENKARTTFALPIERAAATHLNSSLTP